MCTHIPIILEEREREVTRLNFLGAEGRVPAEGPQTDVSIHLLLHLLTNAEHTLER